MKRVIKFRFWTGEKMIQPTEYADVLIKGDGRIFVWTDIQENTGLIEDNNLVPMQFTGMKDVHGKEIYEGDIITYIFDQGRGARRIDEDPAIVYWDGVGFTPWSGGQGESPEVIGNIYENSGLVDTEVDHNLESDF